MRTRLLALLVVAFASIPAVAQTTAPAARPPHLGAIAAAAPARPPNILFVFTDDHATRAIGAYGSGLNRTPHLDRLAAEGVRFDACLVANAICTPSRATIMTGKHSHLNGAHNVGDAIDNRQPMFPDLLRRAGYQTALIGKWHLGHGDRHDPVGFDHWNVLVNQGSYYNPTLLGPGGRRTRIEGYSTDVITDLTLDWLKNRRDLGKPFLMMCHHKAPHREWTPGPDRLDDLDDVQLPEPPDLFDDHSGRASAARRAEMSIARHLTDADLQLSPPANLTPDQLARWRAAFDAENAAYRAAKLTGRDDARWRYQRYVKNYLRCVAGVDDSVGRLLAYLDESGLAADTVVVYSSDQGFFTGEHGWYDKRFMDEPSMRTPLIVRWPGVAPAGRVEPRLASNLDFAQTFLDLAGVAAPADMQGRSLVPLIRGEPVAGWRDAVYYHYYDFPAVHSVVPMLGVRTDRHKLVHYYTLGESELFDLKADPRELRSVHADPAYADVRADLERRLKELQAQYGDAEPTLDPSVRVQRAIRAEAGQVEPHLAFRLASNDGANFSVRFDAARKPVTVGAWCTPQARDGVVLAHGGQAGGYALYLKDGVPRFATRTRRTPAEVAAPGPVTLGRPVHLAGQLTADGELVLLVDGKPVARGPGQFLAANPVEDVSVGRDAGPSFVGEYDGPTPFRGTLRDVRLYGGVPKQDELDRWVSDGAGRRD